MIKRRPHNGRERERTYFCWWPRSFLVEEGRGTVNRRRYYVSVWLREVSVVEFWHVNQWIHRRLVAVH